MKETHFPYMRCLSMLLLSIRIGWSSLKKTSFFKCYLSIRNNIHRGMNCIFCCLIAASLLCSLHHSWGWAYHASGFAGDRRGPYRLGNRDGSPLAPSPSTPLVPSSPEWAPVSQSSSERDSVPKSSQEWALIPEGSSENPEARHPLARCLSVSTPVSSNTCSTTVGQPPGVDGHGSSCSGSFLSPPSFVTSLDSACPEHTCVPVETSLARLPWRNELVRMREHRTTSLWELRYTAFCVLWMKD